MKPPICEVCGKKFKNHHEKELVYFLVRKENPGFLSSLLSFFQPKIAKHPENAAWFCPKHLKAAKKLAANNTKEEAIILQRKTTPQ